MKARSRCVDCRCAGYSLLELIVAMAVSSLALAITAQLLIESQRLAAHSVRRAADPVVELALEQIRADIRAASRIGRSTVYSGWVRDPLDLHGHPQGRVRYEGREHELVRITYRAASSEPAGERVVLRGVSTFRWQLPLRTGDLLQIELGVRRTGRLGALVAGGAREPAVLEERRHTLMLAPRGDGGRAW